ncbi:MAG TPA: hypothetical protein VEV81_13145, partial [Pyrinomonadaceae bacterium]|nr:hypothetical protein [Pyrinomonadaceae bacterium]
MKGSAIFIVLALLLLLIPLHTASAQQGAAPAGQTATPTESEKQAGNNFNSSFAAAEFAADGRTVVQGAPFSAVAVRETTQVLSDGHPFVRRTVASIYRDGEGSMRYEWGNDTKRVGFNSVLTVYDAATGAIYLVYPRRDRADQLAPGFQGVGPRQAKVITPQSA